LPGVGPEARRVGFSQNWYQTFVSPWVTLVRDGGGDRRLPLGPLGGVRATVW
jgi:hypothetical protein